MLLLTEVCGSQAHIDFCDAQKKGKNMVGPVFYCPNHFHTDRRVLFIVLIIDRVLIQEVVPHHFKVVEHGPSFDPAIIYPFLSCLLATAEVSTICRHFNT